MTMRHKLTHDAIHNGYGAFCWWTVVEPEAIGTGAGISSVKNSVGNSVSEVVLILTHT